MWGIVSITETAFESSATHWTGPQIKSLVEELRHEGWTFTYIGANQNVEEVAGSMGIRNSMAFEETDEGTAKMFKKDRRSRSRFFERIRLHVKEGNDCLIEEDGYFNGK